MKTVELAAASGSLAEYATNLDEALVIVTANHAPLAALVPLGNLDPDSVALSLNPQFLDLIHEAREQVRRGEVISLAELETELGEA